MSEGWSLPGYDVECLIGFGATGEAWRAREVTSGETVVLKRLRDGLGPDAVAALRREALLLEELDTPHVVRLREVVGEGADLVLVLDHADGGSLATLLARRGTLSPGEVVTVAAPLAAALAAAHARGLVHGDVTPASVLFRADGMPLLTDLGLARLAGAPPAEVDGRADYVDPAVVLGGEPGAASDVWGLAAVCHHMLAGCAPFAGASADEVLQAAARGDRVPLGRLAGDAPRALVEAVEAGLVADPAARPDAAAFARLVRRSQAAAPVRLHGGPDAADPGPQARPAQSGRSQAGRPQAARSRAVRSHAAPGAVDLRRWRPPRGVLIGVAAAGVLVLAAVAGWVSGRSAAPLSALAAVAPADRSPTSPDSSAAPSPASAPPDWPLVVRQLAAARADALTTAEPSRLLDVYAPSAPALAAEQALLAGLVEAGQQVHGLRHTVHVVELLEESAGSARLRVVDELSPYEISDARGHVVEQAPGRSPTARVVELVRTDAGWRLFSLGT